MNEALKPLTRRALTLGALLFSLAGSPLIGSAQIAYDSAGSTTATSEATVTWTHTVGSGSNTVLVVGVELDDTDSANLPVKTITYDGVAMTAVPNSTATSGTSTLNESQLFYLLKPTAGAHSVSITFAGAVKATTAGSISLSGVNQAAPAAVATNETASGSSLSTSVSVATAGSWLVDAACDNDSSGVFTAGSSQTKRYDGNTGKSDGAGSTEAVASAGTATATWTPASSGRIAQSIAVFAPASGTTVTAPAITTQPSSQTVATGSTATFSVVASGTSPAYQWKFGSSSLSGATSSTLSIANAQSANAGSYTVTVSNSAGSVTSSAATLTVTATVTAPAITTQPSSQTVATGGTATFSVVASGTSPAYQWKFGSSSLSGATSSTLSIANAQSANAGSYTVTVSNSAGSVTSSAATLTVTATVTAPAITTQPASQTVATGGTATFSVVASGTSPAYQWKFGSSSLSGATSSTLSIANAQSANAGSYTVTVSNSAGSVTSSAATLTVTATVTAPAITTQPASQTVATGGTATFSVVASGTSPAYQWKFGSSSLSGATSSTLSIANAQSANAGSYTVTVSNSAGSVTSSAATLTVTATVTAPAITTQPANVTVTAGGTASFVVVASGTSPAYQWKFGSSSLSGATSSTLSIANAQSANAGSYTVTVSNSAGSVTSSAATLTVNAQTSSGSAATITTQPASQSVAAGSTVTFTVVATGTAPITYQWQLNGTNIAGATGSSYSLSNAQAANAGGYSVTVSNSSGPDSSLVATLTTLPIIPAGVFNITSYGAKGDGTTENSAAITAAIAAASAAGGGTVEIPSGTFMSMPISLASSINLQLDKGAMLQAEPPASYGSSGSTVANFVSLNGLHDVEISGEGTIDGNGPNWWGSGGTRPKLVHLSDCTTIYVKNTDPSAVNPTSAPTSGLTLSNSMKEHFICDGNTYPAGTPGGGVNNVTIDGLIVSAPGSSPNTDGIDPCGNHWIIKNCSLSEGDDNVAVKAETASCSDILVNNTWVGTGHGLSIGAQTNYGVDQFRCTNCTYNGTDYVIRLKDEAGEGGPVTNVLYQNITFTGIIKAVVYVSSYYDSLPSNPDTQPSSTTLMPTWQNLVFRNVTGSVTKLEKGLGDIWGIPGYEIDGVVLDNVVINDEQTKDALTINNARHVSYVNGTALPLTTGTDALYNVDPVITVQPASQSVSAGTAVTFSVTAASAGTQTYQWLKNGVAISGATASTYTISSAQSANAGYYSVNVTNATGTNPSDDAILTVN